MGLAAERALAHWQPHQPVITLNTTQWRSLRTYLDQVSDSRARPALSARHRADDAARWAAGRLPDADPMSKSCGVSRPGRCLESTGGIPDALPPRRLL